jgi:hypothetical protein
MSKRIDQLGTLTDSQVEEDSRLLAVGDPATGQLYKVLMSQLKKAASTHPYKYVATGTEGTTLTIPALSGKNIVMIGREGGVAYEVDLTPDTAEFTWDGTDITLGLATNPGERFLILYNSLNA